MSELFLFNFLYFYKIVYAGGGVNRHKRQPDSCASTSCPVGYQCVNGRCIDAKPSSDCVDESCPPGLECVNEICMPPQQPFVRSCAGVLCIIGYECIHGTCIPAHGPCVDGMCPDGLTCVNGKCNSN